MATDVGSLSIGEGIAKEFNDFESFNSYLEQYSRRTKTDILCFQMLVVLMYMYIS